MAIYKVVVSPGTQNIIYDKGSALVPEATDLYISFPGGGTSGYEPPVDNKGPSGGRLPDSIDVSVTSPNYDWLTARMYDSMVNVTDNLCELTLNLSLIKTMPVGSYSAVINIHLDGDLTTVHKKAYVNLEIKDSEGNTPDPNEPFPEFPEPGEPRPEPTPTTYNLKYFIQYNNIQGDTIRTEILERGYMGEVKEAFGMVTLSYQERKDAFSPIIASHLSINFEASNDFTMSDLYSEDEETFVVRLIKDNKNIFIGYLKPDGIFESLVDSRWQLSIDAYDGLSILKKLSFTNNDGTNILGKISIIKAIYKCLLRTKINLPINYSIPLIYDGARNNRTLENSVVDTQRFFQEGSGKEEMNCEDVLTSLLTLFNASIYQFEGEWYISRTVDIKRPEGFYRYVNGVYAGLTERKVKDVYIGSHINNNSTLFHINANQTKTISPSVQAYKLYYKHGFASGFVTNVYLQKGYTSGSNIILPGFTVTRLRGKIHSSDVWFETDKYVKPLGGDGGLMIEANPATLFGTKYNGEFIRFNQTVNVNKGDIPKIVGSFQNLKTRKYKNAFLEVAVWTDTHRLNESNQWIEGTDNGATKAARISMNHVNDPGGNGDWRGFNFEIVPPPVPNKTRIYASLGFSDVNIHETAYFNYFNILPSESNIKGFNYTAQRGNRVSTVTKPDRTVYNGDSATDFYVGTLYKADGIATTETWKYTYGDVLNPLLVWNVVDNLRVAPKPMIEYEGDISGFFPYLCSITFDLVPGNYIPMKYEYDTWTGQIRLTARQIETADLSFSELRNGEVVVEEDYGNETKVNIKS